MRRPASDGQQWRFGIRSDRRKKSDFRLPHLWASRGRTHDPAQWPWRRVSSSWAAAATAASPNRRPGPSTRAIGADTQTAATTSSFWRTGALTEHRPAIRPATDSNHPGWPGSGAGASRANAADPPAEMGRTAETGNDARRTSSDSIDNTHSRRTPHRTHSWHDSPVSRASATRTGSAVRTSGDEGNRWPSRCRPSASRRRSPCTTMARTSRCAVGTDSPTCRASSLDLMGVVSTASRIATTRSSTPTPVPRASDGEPGDALVPSSRESLVTL
jgi:hypothetical protein